MNKGFAIITGANGQVGSHLAHAFAGKGIPLLLLYHDHKQRIESLQDARAVMLAACDLSQPNDLSGLIDQAASAFQSPPAILIHCASLRSRDAMALGDSDSAAFSRVLNTNVMSFYHIMHQVLPQMIAQQFGRVVVFGSAVTQTGLANGAAYAAAKAAMVNMVKSIAREVGQYNILINAISPAPIETDLEADYQGEYLQFRKDYFERYRASSPSGKLVSMNEIQALVELLIKAELENLTAQEIYIHGASQ